MDQLPRLGKKELICLLLFTCNYVVSVWIGSLFLWMLGMGYVIFLWHSLSLPYNYFFITPVAILAATVCIFSYSFFRIVHTTSISLYYKIGLINVK